MEKLFQLLLVATLYVWNTCVLEYFTANRSTDIIME